MNIRSTGGVLNGMRRAALPAVLLLVLLTAIRSVGAPEPQTPTAADRGRTAESIRECDLDAVREATAEGGGAGRLLLGLAAYGCNDPALAAERLAAPLDGHPWNDLRLLALADSASQSDQHGLALEAVQELLRDHRGSPVHPLAFPVGARVARAAGRPGHAVDLIAEARTWPVSEELRTELDLLAWEIAQEPGQESARLATARSLLLHSPADASDLEVASALVPEGAKIPWVELFTVRELEIRSANLIRAEMAEAALETLTAVPEEERDVSWHLLHARALIEERRGTEALDALLLVRGGDIDERQALDLLRAEAALDAATARRGRVNLPAAEREQMRLLARGHLWQVVRLDGRSAVGLDALRLLFEELADGEHFEQVRSILARLRATDPHDTTGLRYLWRLGWSEYRQRNPSGAVGYWSELVEIYPDTKAARRGRYWSARAHEELGNPSRAGTLLEMLAATPSTDYYAKLARERLGRDSVEPTRLSGSPEASWPRDPALERVESLTEAGLDALALEELDRLRGVTDRRTDRALRSRILAAQGRRRESIQHLWQAFPDLGSARQDSVPPEALTMYYPLDFLDVVERFADDNDLEVSLLLAMIRQESAFDVRARSRAGARGLMQVMPATGRELAEKMGLRFSTGRLNDPSFSVQLGSRYFRQVLDMFDGRLELALAGYNAGPYRIRRLVREAGPDLEIDRFVEDLRFEESKTYVRRIILFSDSYRRLYPELG